MKTAKITCLTRMARLPDLDLELTKGDEVLLSPAQVEKSKDLALMRRLNAVSLLWVHRAALRSPAPRPRPTVLPFRPRPRQPHVALPPTPPTPAQDSIDLEKLAERLARRVVEKTIDRLVDAVRATPQPMLVRRGEKASVGTVVSPEAPVFIPSNIVDQDAKTDIQTKKTQSSGSGVSDAAAALKKARRAKKDS